MEVLWGLSKRSPGAGSPCEGLRVATESRIWGVQKLLEEVSGWGLAALPHPDLVLHDGGQNPEPETFLIQPRAVPGELSLSLSSSKPIIRLQG